MKSTQNNPQTAKEPAEMMSSLNTKGNSWTTLVGMKGMDNWNNTDLNENSWNKTKCSNDPHKKQKQCGSSYKANAQTKDIHWKQKHYFFYWFLEQPQPHQCWSFLKTLI